MISTHLEIEVESDELVELERRSAVLGKNVRAYDLFLNKPGEELTLDVASDIQRSLTKYSKTHPASVALIKPVQAIISLSQLGFLERNTRLVVELIIANPEFVNHQAYEHDLYEFYSQQNLGKDKIYLPLKTAAWEDNRHIISNATGYHDLNVSFDKMILSKDMFPRAHKKLLQDFESLKKHQGVTSVYGFIFNYNYNFLKALTEMKDIILQGSPKFDSSYLIGYDSMKLKEFVVEWKNGAKVGPHFQVGTIFELLVQEENRQMNEMLDNFTSSLLA